MILQREFGKENVKLLPIDPERDHRELFVLFQDERMHRYTGNTVPVCLAETKQMLASYVNNPSIWAWAIYDIRLQKLIGTYWLALPVEQEGERIITADAQRIGVPYWRKGYARTCRDMLYGFAFGELNVDAIYAQAWEENTASCGAMTAYGFRLENRIWDAHPKSGREMYANTYKLSREDFFRKQHERSPAASNRLWPPKLP